MEKIAWLVLGSVTLVAAVFAGRNRRALYVGRAALGMLYLGAGALVNAVYLATGESYADFADAAHFSFVRDTWRSLVVPNHGFFISLLIAFEVAVGVLISAADAGRSSAWWASSASTSGCWRSAGC
jgi:hypothetical protein